MNGLLGDCYECCNYTSPLRPGEILLSPTRPYSFLLVPICDFLLFSAHKKRENRIIYTAFKGLFNKN